MNQTKTKPYKRRLKSFIFINVFGILSITAVTISSCANSSTSNSNLVFGNFESYISPELQSELQNEYSNLNFDYYSSNENMISNFKNGTYTIGVPSTYAVIELVQSKQLQLIDWSKFGLHEPGTAKPIENANDALSLFTKPVQDILTGYGSYGISNLLDYSVPYFFQSYIFAYRGNLIPEFADPANPPTWSQILDYVGAHPERFDNGRFGAVEDERSLFSVAKLIANTESSAPGETISVNPKDNNPKPSIEQYMDVFSNLSSNNRINSNTLGSKPVPIFLNSDSNVILNSLALGNLNGAMLFNGDAIFAALGGDVASDNKPTGNDFHIVTPKYTPLALDLMVINNTTTKNNPELLNETYDIIKKVGLQGSDETDPEIFQEEQEKTTPTGEPLYVNGPMQNFSYILYTSPLKIISDLSDSNNSVVNGAGFFDDENDPNLVNEIISAYNIGIGKNLISDNINNFIEQPINAWQKQAMVNAYLRFKEKMWN